MLGAGHPAAVAEAHRIIDLTVEAVIQHGHGQGTDDDRRLTLLGQRATPIVCPPGPGPRVELVSPEWSGAPCNGLQYD